MSPLFILFLCVYPLLGGGGLIAFVQAARQTSLDWDTHPAIHRLELAWQAEEQAVSETNPRLPSRAS